MPFLKKERETLAACLPGLDEKLKDADFYRMEGPETEAIGWFRSAGGPGLLIPRRFGGLQVSPFECLQIQRAIGSRAPSLAVATTMHHFSVATLLPVCSAPSGMAWVMLQAIASQKLLLASGFAEGQSGRSALRPMMQGRVADGGIRVTGSKRPCSLSRSMDLLVASVSVSVSDAEDARFAVVLVGASSQGLERRPFWRNSVLNGAESDEVFLHDVFVPDRLVFYPSGSVQEESNEGTGFIWFELLISATYLGIASALVERVLIGGRGTALDRVLLLSDLESAMAALEGAAQSLTTGSDGSSDLARALFVRYSVQHSIERATSRAMELLGGMAFATTAEPTYLYAASRGLAFHPPSRLAATESLNAFIGGAPFRLE